MQSASHRTTRRCPACGATYHGDALYCAHDGAPLVDAPNDGDPYLGRELLGNIQIRELVGVGAMGRVYRAFQRGMDRDVAVKILRRELSSNAQLVARFQREAKVASKLHHPHVVHAYLNGQLPDDALYIVMEFLDGRSLQQAIAQQPTFSLKRALHVTLQVCNAVGEAHAHGIVHRDIKPENVMLVRRGHDPDFVKVLDFGVARLNWGEQSMATQAGLIFGTARYVSPEGAQGLPVGPSGDVYSIATLLYQLLSGRTPFDAEQAVGLLVCQIHDVPPELHSLPEAAHVPKAIVDLIMRNLSKRPEEREADARAFGFALAEAAEVCGIDISTLAHGEFRRSAKGPLVDALARTRPYDPSGPTSSGVGNRPSETESPRLLHGQVTARLEPSQWSSRPIVRIEPTLDDQSAVRYSNVSSSPEGAAERAPSEGVSSLPPKPTRSAMRTWIGVFLVLCAASAIALAIKLGVFGQSDDDAKKHHLDRTWRAVMHGRFDSPPGENVRDLTREGMTRWPQEADYQRYRALAANDLVLRARDRHREGDLLEALRLIKLAREFDPAEIDAVEQARTLEDERALIYGADTTMQRGAMRIAIVWDASLPLVGVPIDVHVHALRTASLKDVWLDVSGPGLAKPVRLPMKFANGLWNASYAFGRKGRYEVAVVATDEKGDLRATRSIQVSDPPAR